MKPTKPEPTIPLCTVEIHNHLDSDDLVVSYDTPQLGKEAVDDFGQAAIASEYFLHAEDDDPLQVSIQYCDEKVVIHWHCEPGREDVAREIFRELQNGPFQKGGEPL